MQYPVFPFILRDYTSETLDLQDSSIYRCGPSSPVPCSFCTPPPGQGRRALQGFLWSQPCTQNLGQTPAALRPDFAFTLGLAGI